jgi:hypothetical protein
MKLSTQRTTITAELIVVLLFIFIFVYIATFLYLSSNLSM